MTQKLNRENWTATFKCHTIAGHYLFFPFLAVRVQCMSLNVRDPHHTNQEVMPDATSADIVGLREKTDYLVMLVVETAEYFDQLPPAHPHKNVNAIPPDILIGQDDSPWLPNASIVAKTAGTDAPASIRVSRACMTSLMLSWTPPLVYGSNRLLNQVMVVGQLTVHQSHFNRAFLSIS